jgi:hypothetical protein
MPRRAPLWPLQRFDLPAEGGVRAFVLSDCRGVVTLQAKRLTKSFSRAAGLGLSQSILECVASRGGVAGVQGRPTLVDHGRAHQI